NFPTDVMKLARRGPVIGVDAAREGSLRPQSGPAGRPGWQRLFGNAGGPTIISLLMRAATVSSEATAILNRQLVDVLMQPPMSDIDIQDWRAIDRAIELGYRQAVEVLERDGAALPRV